VSIEATALRLSRACPVCGASGATMLHCNAMVPVDGIDLSYDVRECSACGAAFADGLAPPSDYDRYYRDCSKYDLAADGGAIPASDFARAAVAVELAALAPRGRPAGVLDIGCGAGTLLAGFRDAGAVRLAGIDPGAESPATARRVHALDGVTIGTWRDALRRDDLGEFNLFCMTGVLEHLPEVDAVLGGLRSRMPASSCVLIEVPAVECFGEGDFEPFGEFSLEHVNFFSEAGLRVLARRLGFEVIATRIERAGGGVTGSLFALLQPSEPAVDDGRARCPGLGDYVLRSAAAFERVVAAWTAKLGDSPAIVYGAGSHSARLLATLEQRGLAVGIRCVVDGNPNLHGRRFGRWVVESPGVLKDSPQVPIVVSSFRSEVAIAQSLRARLANPIHTLYDRATGAGDGRR